MRRIWITTAVVLLAAAAYLVYQRYFVAVLDVTSEPTGAEVHVNGRRVGLTPLRGQLLPPGLYRVEVRHSHYRPVERRLGLEAGPTEMHVTLQPGTGTLTVYSNPRGAWVEVDGERQRGATPLKLTLPSGEHEIAMGMDERRSAATSVTVNSGEDAELRLELNVDPHGSLTVVVEPADARVTLPDAGHDYRPGVRLPLGEYRVQVARSGYVTQDLRLPVKYGDNRHRVTLKRAYAPLTVTTAPADASVTVRYAEVPGGPLRRHAHRAGAELPTGTVEVRATAMGRRSAFRRIELGNDGARLHFDLAPMTVEPGSRLRDRLASGGEGPLMVVLPAGTFRMGSAAGPPSERPARRVVLTQPFAVSAHEVTQAEYARFDPAHRPAEGEPAAPDLPVSRVSFEQATTYAQWLSEQTGERYRLPSEAEWEYMARAGSTGEFWFGDDPLTLCRYANVADSTLRRRYRSYQTVDCDDGFEEHAPVGSFPANAFGVFDVHGNVAEWVLECGLPEYAGAPDDGAPLDEGPNCPTHGVRGGSWSSSAADARLAKRNVASSASPDRGIRLVREF